MAAIIRGEKLFCSFKDGVEGTGLEFNFWVLSKGDVPGLAKCFLFSGLDEEYQISPSLSKKALARIHSQISIHQSETIPKEKNLLV